MGTAKRLRTDDVAGGGTPAPLVDGRVAARNTGANMGTGDVRMGAAQTTVLTPKGEGAGDEFKVEVWGREDSGDWAVLGTSRALTHGTDWTAANLQSDIRGFTGWTSSGVTVAGSDNSALTITWGNWGKYAVRIVDCTGGMAIVVSDGAISYDEGSEQDGTPYSGTGVPSTNGRLFDVESSDHAGKVVPLGSGAITDGTGQAAGTVLLPPTIDSVVGNNGDGTLVISTTEAASGGTGAEVLVGIYDLDAEEWVLVDTQDADGDYTATGLDPADVVVVLWTQTANGQVSRPSDPVYAAVT